MSTKQMTKGRARKLGSVAVAASLLLGSGWALAQTPYQGDPAADAPEGMSYEVWVVQEQVPEQPAALYELHDPSVPMSRAEVIADLNLWRRAGLGAQDADNPGAHVDLEERLQAYQDMRSSPVFLAEVQRVQAQRDEVEAGAALDDGAPQQ